MNIALKGTLAFAGFFGTQAAVNIGYLNTQWGAAIICLIVFGVIVIPDKYTRAR